MPEYKQLSLRFNLENEKDKEVYDYLQNPYLNKNAFVKQSILEKIEKNDDVDMQTINDQDKGTLPFESNPEIKNQNEQEKNRKRLTKNMGFKAE